MTVVQSYARTGSAVRRLSCAYNGSSLMSFDDFVDLIAKGAVLRKGERLRSRFCKFIKGMHLLTILRLHHPDQSRISSDPRDSIFTAHLFVSDTEELCRYVAVASYIAGVKLRRSSCR